MVPALDTSSWFARLLPDLPTLELPESLSAQLAENARITLPPVVPSGKRQIDLDAIDPPDASLAEVHEEAEARAHEMRSKQVELLGEMLAQAQESTESGREALDLSRQALHATTSSKRAGWIADWAAVVAALIRLAGIVVTVLLAPWPSASTRSIRVERHSRPLATQPPAVWTDGGRSPRVRRECGAAMKTTVRALRPGQVISMPDTNLDPSFIVSITTLKDSRSLRLVDLESGEARDALLVLGMDRTVVLHDAIVTHHYYRNEGHETIDVDLGLRSEAVAPGETYHYTGVARPDLFGDPPWRHVVLPVVDG